MGNLQVLERTKICSTCMVEKSVFDFTKNNAAKDKLQYKCKACDLDYQTKRREENRLKMLDYSRKYQTKKRKEFDYRLQMLLNASRQRSKKKSRENNLTIQDIKDAFPKDGLCPIFGIKMAFGNVGFRENSPSIDRLDSKKGYTRDNIQIISWKANRIKKDASIEELELILAYMKQGM